MTTYELWDDIPNGVTVYASFHNLLAIKLESATLVAITEYEGKAGWMQTTGRLKGPFEDVYGGLVTLDQCIVPKPAPRQWLSLADVPTNIRVRDADGDVWKFKKGGWIFQEDGDGHWVEWAPLDLRSADRAAPFTEIAK